MYVRLARREERGARLEFEHVYAKDRPVCAICGSLTFPGSAAQSKQARAQDSMPLSTRQLFAHASQTSAHTPHTRAWKGEPLV